MTRKYALYQVDSFTTELFRGNPAGVVLDAQGLGDVEMQAVAREMNNSETAFILPPEGPDHEVRVRFFTPTVEVPSCGHATIAAHYVRALAMGLSDCRVVQKIGAGVLPVDIEGGGESMRVVMTQGAVDISPDLDQAHQSRILEALGVPQKDHDPALPMRISSTGHSKVMVSLRQEELLHELAPDMAALTAISRDIGCNGYYAFVLSPDTDPAVHGRMFAPAIGIGEDPVTGNANGPLGAYLADLGYGPRDGEFRFRAVQGEAMGRKGEILVKVAIEGGRPHHVTVSGQAVIVFKAEMVLP